jgi:hypothetical protein
MQTNEDHFSNLLNLNMKIVNHTSKLLEPMVQVVSMINDKFVVPLVLYPWHFSMTRNHSISYTLHVWLLLEVVASISVIVIVPQNDTNF